MKVKILKDVTISCEPPRVYNYGRKTMEDIAKEYEGWVQDFASFIRDHRSQDPVHLNVERIYTEVCSFCGNEWEVDQEGIPQCCHHAIAESIEIMEVGK